MAGKRHHYNPRWLVAGFATNESREGSRIWVYRKDETVPKLVSTRAIGVSKHFYAYKSGEKVRSADPVMTEQEASQFAPAFRQLREQEAGVLSDKARISAIELLAHIAGRSGEVRHYFDAEVVAAAFEELIRTPAIVNKYLNCGTHLELFVKLHQEMPEMMNNIYRNPDDYQNLDALANLLLRSVDWIGVFSEIPKIGQVEALHESLYNRHIIDEGAQLLLEIQDYPSAEFIQSDAPLTYCLADGSVTSLNLNHVPISWIVLPLSPTRLLIARRKEVELPDWRAIRSHIVECSRHYFVAKSSSDELIGLTSIIGAKVPRMSADIKELLVQEFERTILEEDNNVIAGEEEFFINLITARAVRE